MSDFKKGDRVRYRGRPAITGTIAGPARFSHNDTSDRGDIAVDWDDGHSYNAQSERLEPVPIVEQIAELDTKTS